MLLKNNITIREKKQRSFLSLLLRLFERNEMLTNSVISRVYAIYKKEKWRSLLSFLKRHFLPPPTLSPAPHWISLPTPQPQWTFTK